MGRSFNDSTDRIDWLARWNMTGEPITVSFWIYRTEGAEQSYLWERGQDDSNYGFAIMHRGDLAAGRLGFMRRVGTQNMLVEADALDANSWVQVVVTDDGVDPADGTSVKMYKFGVELSYTRQQGGIGAESSFAATYWCVGGRYYDDLRNFGGYLGVIGVWNLVAPSSMITALGAGYSPEFFPEKMKFHAPLRTHAFEYRNRDAARLDGTLVAPHPPRIIYPIPVFYSIPAPAGVTLAERGVMRGVGRGVMRGVN